MDTVLDHLEPFRFQTMPPQSLQHIGQPFRPVSQGKAPAVAQQIARGGTDLIQGAVRLFTAGAA